MSYLLSRELKVGKVYRKSSGKIPYEVLKKTEYDRIVVKNLNTGKIYRWGGDVYYARFVEVDEGEINMNKKTIYYNVKGTNKFGKLLAFNENGDYVLEIKGSSGGVEVFSKKDVQKVVPWTFSVKFIGDRQATHYRGRVGLVEVNDVVMINTKSNVQIGIVTEIDTKNESAAAFKGAKLITESMDVDGD